MKKQLLRRILIKSAILTLASSAYGFNFIFGSKKEKKIPNIGKTLILYFSQTDTTKFLAKEIHKRVGGDIVEIKPVKPYVGTYKQLKVIADKEQKIRRRPKLVDNIPDLAKYDTIFIGWPTWLYTMPMPMFTLLENNDLSGKNVVPFNTHGGTGFSDALNDMKRIASKSNYFKGLEIYHDDIKDKSTKSDIKEWLKELGFSKSRNS